jgi:hypothetical protein
MYVYSYAVALANQPYFKLIIQSLKHLSLKTTESNVGKDVKKLKSLCTAGWNVKYDAATMENNMVTSQKITMKLSYDPVILSLDIYPKKNEMH